MGSLGSDRLIVDHVMRRPETRGPWSRARGALGALLGVLVFLATGCGDRVQTAGPGAVTPEAVVKTSSRVSDFEARLDHLLVPEAYRYSPTGKSDPFKPFWAVASVGPRSGEAGGAMKLDRPPKQCATALECMDVGQLTLVAVITQRGGPPVAMAQDASGVGYLLRPELRVGYRNGRVRQIMADRVIVTEEIESISGKIATQDRVLLLHPEGK